jgi:hypothetical protein
MFHRRIIASACALALVVPAAASAVPAQDPPGASLFAGKAHHIQRAVPVPGITYADTKYDAQNQQDLGAPTPTASTDDTKSDAQNQQYRNELGNLTGDTKNDLPKGNPVPVSAPAPTAQPADDGTNGWLIAALVEGAVLAAVVLAAGMAVTRTRRRPAGLGV